MPDWRDLGGAAIRGFFGGMSGKTPNQVGKEERERQRRVGSVAVNEAALRQFIQDKQQEWDRQVAQQRAEGNKQALGVMFTDGWFDGRAIVRFQMGGERGRMDIFYGGTDNNPLANDDHGHVIVKSGGIVEWWLPGPKGRRQRAI